MANLNIEIGISVKLILLKVKFYKLLFVIFKFIGIKPKELIIGEVKFIKPFWKGRKSLFYFANCNFKILW